MRSVQLISLRGRTQLVVQWVTPLLVPTPELLSRCLRKGGQLRTTFFNTSLRRPQPATTNGSCNFGIGFHRQRRFGATICGRRFGVVKRIRERRRTPFYLSGDTFNASPISVATDPRSELEPIECRREIRCGIDEDRGVVEVLFVAEFVRKQHSEKRSSRRKQPYIENFVRFGINGSVQPAAFVVDLDHCLVNHNLLWIPLRGGLQLGFVDPVVDSSSTAVDSQNFDMLFCIRK